MQSDLFTAPAVPEAPTLRPYQAQALDEVQTMLDMGTRAVLVVAPTGAGKTVLAAEMIRRNGHRRILFLAPRRELIHQAVRKLTDVGVNAGVILAGDTRVDQYALVQVASEDTLIARALRKGRRYQDFDLILKDEAHVGVSDARERLFALWPKAQIVGLTATPCRSDGKALGRVYDEMVVVASVAQLIADGFLVPDRPYSISEPDLKRVRTTAGEYNGKDLEAVMNRPKLVGDIVQHWLEHAATRRTVVFATSIAHSMALCKQFISHGVSAEHVDANTPQEARETTFENFKTGRTQVLTNCTLASIGFDLPELDCVVFARPTKSLGLFIQMLGRGLRPAPGKTDCLVLDHAGNVLRHGRADEPRFWTLHGKYAQDEAKVKAHRQKKEKEGALEIRCPECSAVFSGTNQCPECGYHFPAKPKAVETMKGRLVALAASPSDDSAFDRRTFYLMLAGHAKLHGYSLGWAAHKFKERLGEWPPWSWKDGAEAAAITPSLEVSRWIRSRQIAWARSRSNASSPAKIGAG